MHAIRSAYRTILRFLITDRHGIGLSLFGQALTAKPSDLEVSGSVVARLARRWQTPLAAAALLGFGISFCTSEMVLASPASDTLPGRDLVSFLNKMEVLTRWCSIPVTFAGIYLISLLKMGWLAAQFRILALVAPVGRLPSLHFQWHLMRTSFGAAALGVLALGAGFFLSRGGTAAFHDLPDQGPRALVFGVGLGGLLFIHLRNRNEKKANLEIWGPYGTGLLAALMNVGALVGLLWLLPHGLPLVSGLAIE